MNSTQTPLQFKFKALDQLNFPYLRAIQCVSSLNNGTSKSRIDNVVATRTHFVVTFDSNSLYVFL